MGHGLTEAVVVLSTLKYLVVKQTQNKQSALRLSAPAVASILLSSSGTYQVEALIVLIVLSNYWDNEYLLYDSVRDCGQAR